MTEDRRRHHAGNAAAGLALTAAGESAGQAITHRYAGKAGRAGAMVLPRGAKIIGVPLAAAGVVGAARDKGRPQKVNLRDMPGDVAHRTVAIPELKRKKVTTQRAGDAAAATLAGVGGGMVARRLVKTPRASAVAGTVGSLSAASAALYGRQRGREDKVKKAQKVLVQPAPSVQDTREDWKIHRQRSQAANMNMAATGLGATALAAQVPKIIHPMTKDKKLLKFRRHSGKISTALGGAAAVGYTVGGVKSFKTQRHDLAVQGRRLRERDQALHRKSPADAGPVKKADRFTRKYAQNISPQAEQGYEYLRRGRNKKAGHAALAGALTGVNTHAAVRGGKIGRPLGAGLAVLTGTAAVQQARGAHRWNGHMKKIKAKAYERAARGELGRERTVAKEDLAKALVLRPSGLPFPKGLKRAPALRSGGVRRTASGKTVAFRGSYG